MSKLDQIHSRPATITLTTRCDARYLATLIRFWHAQGELPKSNSELIRLSIESFAEFLILNNKIDFVQTQQDALDILKNTGLNVHKINPKNLAEALVAEGATLESLHAPHIDQRHRETTASRPLSKDSPELDVARAKFSDLMTSDLAKRVKDANSRTEDFKNQLFNPPVENDSNDPT